MLSHDGALWEVCGARGTLQVLKARLIQGFSGTLQKGQTEPSSLYLSRARPGKAVLELGALREFKVLVLGNLAFLPEDT